MRHLAVRLTLRARIMICCVGLVILLALAVVIFVRRRLSETLRAEYVNKGRKMAANLAEGSEHLVLTEDLVSLRERCAELKASDEDLEYVYVADRGGRVLAHTFAGGFPADLTGVNIPQPGDVWTRELLDTTEAGLIHDLAVPVLGGRLGAVHVGLSEARLARTISQFTAAIVAITCIVLLAAGALAAAVSWVVTQPVRDLTEAAQKIRDGELGQQVAATTKDELGDLVESFNQMSNELLRQHQALKDRNRGIRIAQEQVAQERDKLRAIIDGMVEGVIFVDAEDRISLCNESAGRIWQGTASELLGQPLLECHPPDVRPMVTEILSQARDRPGFAVAHTMKLRKGSCLSSYSSVHREDGRYLGLVLLSLDISERVALEQEHERLRDELFQHEKMALIGQIAASVAHELNTPLSTILLRAQLLRRQRVDDGELSDLEVVESEAQRCRRIIDSLLGFARRSEGTMSRTDLQSLVHQSLSLLENDLTRRGVSVETDYASDGAAIRADGGQILQVLMNLVTNARDAMPEGGRLRIATAVPSGSGTVVIHITDEGCGMEPNVLEKAFDSFFTTKPPGKGTGLGLAICERIVEEHSGRIEIQSEPAQGTTVTVRLPMVPAKGSVDD